MENFWIRNLAFLGVGLFPLVFFGTSQAQTPSTIIETRIEGTIHSGTVSILEEGIQKVREQKAQALLIELDTPGGLLESTRDIVKLFLNSDVPIFVYVCPPGARAGSAGTFITMAAHIAAMAPATNIGAAHPVSITGGDPEKSGGEHMGRKIENDTIAFIETIAKQRNRNVDWAKKAVLKSDAIDDQKALSLHVIDVIAKDKQDLLQKIDGRKVTTKLGEITLRTAQASLVPLKIDFNTKAKNWLANPAVMFILLLITGVGFYVEFSHPGLILPAVAGTIALLLLLIANSVLPLSVVGVGLIILAFAFLIGEVYVGSFGLLALGGLVAFVVGAYFLFDSKQTDLRVPRGLIWGAASGIGTIAVVIAFALSRTLRAKQTAGIEGMIGSIGIVEQPISPNLSGRIFINGEYWDADSQETLEKGQQVEIISIQGLRANVKRRGGV